MYEGHDQIVERPGDDDAVVDVKPEHNRHCRVANTLGLTMMMMMGVVVKGVVMMMMVMVRMMKTWSMGTSWPTMVRPPVPRYWPAATSC